MTVCRGCGAPIRFIGTAGGKSIPVDPDAVLYWQRAKAKGKVVTPNGELISCDFEGDPNTPTGTGYVPHWATCPKADQFRRGRKGGGRNVIPNGAG